MTKAQAKVLGQATIIGFDETPERLLMIDISIDCDVCGEHTFRFAGHHIPAILRYLSEVAEEHQDLIGEAGHQVVDRLKFATKVPMNPGDN